MATRIHLVRHGEVWNPEHVLYGRLPGFGLSPRGKSMAHATAQVFDPEHVVGFYASPLQRTQESAAPIAEVIDRQPVLDPRLIETGNVFEGKPLDDIAKAWRHPGAWRYLLRPAQPSWGEPYQQIAERMLAAMRSAAGECADGDIVMVSHELPIWMVHRAVAHEKLAHNPGHRRCSLSSVTSFEYDPATRSFREIDYREPAKSL